MFAQFLYLMLLLLSGAVGETIRSELVDRNVVLDRLRSCPKKDLDRQEQLKALFTAVGCTGPSLTFDHARRSKLGNVVCTLQGSSPEKIIVGAHFDHAAHGEGAIDNWSGTSLLPSLYKTLAK